MLVIKRIIPIILRLWLDFGVCPFLGWALPSFKYLSFKIESFSENTEIFTSQDVKYIYILDKEHKALAVFTKKGELVNQYAIEISETLNDFHIDEENQTAYILSENSVYSIPIQE